MATPKIIYDAGAGAVTLTFARGPQGFRCTSKATVHDNQATSGIRERVMERVELVLSFTMGHLRVDDDLDDWSTFMAWALVGESFQFFPDSAQATYYNVVSADEGFDPARVAPGVYSASFVWLIVPDVVSAAATTGSVMRQFYGYVD